MASNMSQSTHPYDSDRAAILSYLPHGSQSVLDVGCSTGRFCGLVKAKHPDAEVWGIEPHPDAAQEARSRADQVIEGHYPDDLPEVLPLFDAVFFNDVLEHMVDPWEVLSRTRGLLTPEGRVIASIPNVRYWAVLERLVWKADFSYDETGVLDRTHLRFFTRSTMEDLFHGAGFAVEVCEPINVSDRRKSRVLSWLLPGGFDVRVMQYVLVGRLR